MESDRHFELYLAEFRQWGTPAELRVLMRWGTPAEVAALLKAIGSPDDALSVLVALKARQDAWEWSQRFWGRVKSAAIAAGLTGGVLGAVIAALTLVERLRMLWHG